MIVARSPCKISHRGTRSPAAFCHQLLAETGIATAPGVDFDTATGNRFVRLSFAAATDEVAEALERLGHWLP